MSDTPHTSEAPVVDGSDRQKRQAKVDGWKLHDEQTIVLGDANILTDYRIAAYRLGMLVAISTIDCQLVNYPLLAAGVGIARDPALSAAYIKTGVAPDDLEQVESDAAKEEQRVYRNHGGFLTIPIPRVAAGDNLLAATVVRREALTAAANRVPEMMPWERLATLLSMHLNQPKWQKSKAKAKK